MHPGARLKKNIEESFSVELALMSVARRRYLEYHGLSTCQPHISDLRCHKGNLWLHPDPDV